MLQVCDVRPVRSYMSLSVPQVTMSPMSPPIPLLLLVTPSLAGLLGAGQGEGSCAAPPFRAPYVKWSGGCPGFAPCCTEYGYCRPLVSDDILILTREVMGPNGGRQTKSEACNFY